MQTYIRNISLKLRLYPTKDQETYFSKCFGCSRFIYNFYLNERNQFYENNIKGIENKKKRSEIYKTYKETSLKELKEQFVWLREIESQAICQSYLNISSSFDRFFKGQSKHPKFHSKRGKNSYKSCMPSQDLINWNEHTVKIPRIGKVSFKHRSVPKFYRNRTKVCNITISKVPSGKYYVSVLFECKFEKLNKSINTNNSIGLDFDCDDCYIDSNSKSAKQDFGFKKQKQQNLKHLSHLQRQVIRKHKHSKNFNKSKTKLAKFEEYVANCRRDWIEKESLRLVRTYDLIGLENLSIQGMMKGSKNAKNYLDISWSAFVEKLTWKSSFHNCDIMKIGKFFASSQTCSCCGYKFKDVALKHLEVWKCPSCGQVHQRDVNAAVNIRNEAVKLYEEVLRGPEESSVKAFSGALPQSGQNRLSPSQLANLSLAS